MQCVFTEDQNEIAFPEKTSINAPHAKVKIKGVVKMALPTKFMRSTKRMPSYFEHVDLLHSQEDSCSTKKIYGRTLTTNSTTKIHSFL